MAAWRHHRATTRGVCGLQVSVMLLSMGDVSHTKVGASAGLALRCIRRRLTLLTASGVSRCPPEERTDGQTCFLSRHQLCHSFPYCIHVSHCVPVLPCFL